MIFRKCLRAIHFKLASVKHVDRRSANKPIPEWRLESMSQSLQEEYTGTGYLLLSDLLLL